MKTYNLTFVLLFCICFNAFAANPDFTQAIHIPDPHLKHFLLNDASINLNGDTEIQKTEALTYTGSLDVSGLGISDMTGIENFDQINYLNCSNNHIFALTLNNHPLLEELECNNNQLSTLDLKHCTRLRRLICHDNNLSKIDLSDHPDLTDLDCKRNNLASLDLSLNPNLLTLDCDNNQLTELDVSLNSDLYMLFCRRNRLTILNMANGNNASILPTNFAAQINMLSCVQVDDENYATTLWTGQVDAGVMFSDNCSLLGMESTELELKPKLYPNPASSHFTVDLGKEVTGVSIELHNSIGELIFSKEYESIHQANLDLPSVPGVYWVSVFVGEEQHSILRIIKI